MTESSCNGDKQPPRKLREWNDFAASLAEKVYDQIFEAHRGAFPINESYSAVFGNDGYGDERVGLEIELLRQRLQDSAIEEVAFGFDSSKYAWLLIVRTADVATLHEWVSEAWNIACNGGDKKAIEVGKVFALGQGGIAEEAVARLHLGDVIVPAETI